MNTPAISVIIAHLNDLCQLHSTVESILTTAFGDIEVIIVDDGSVIDQKPIRRGWLNDSRVHLISYGKQVGVAYARTVGVERACGEWLLITDSHMIFPDGWDVTFANYARLEKDGIWSGTYVTCDSEGKQAESFTGSRLEFIRQIGNIVHVLDQFPEREPDNRDTWSVTPCIIGAAYFITKVWWKKINGADGLIGWGGDEQILSLKTYLAGKTCRVMPDLVIKHIRQMPPIGRNASWKILYNKMLINAICLRHSPSQMNVINRAFTKASIADFVKASGAMALHEKWLFNEYKTLELIRMTKIEDYCERFGIDTPEEAWQLLGTL